MAFLIKKKLKKNIIKCLNFNKSINKQQLKI